MDYLIGNVNTKIINDILSDTNFNIKTDTITFHNDSINNICLHFTNDISLRNFTIRGCFSNVSNDDIALWYQFVLYN